MTRTVNGKKDNAASGANILFGHSVALKNIDAKRKTEEKKKREIEKKGATADRMVRFQSNYVSFLQAPPNLFSKLAASHFSHPFQIVTCVGCKKDFNFTDKDESLAKTVSNVNDAMADLKKTLEGLGD